MRQGRIKTAGEITPKEITASKGLGAVKEKEVCSWVETEEGDAARYVRGYGAKGGQAYADKHV